MIKKYCNVCEREIGPKVTNILNTGIAINKDTKGEYIIALSNPDDTDRGYFADDRALCAVCFLEAVKKEFKEDLPKEIKKK